MLMKDMDELKRKYWNGISDLDEEQALKRRFSADNQEQIENEFFNYLAFKKEEKLTDRDFDSELISRIKNIQEAKRSLFHKINWRIAAAVLVLFTAGILFMKRQMDSKGIITSSDPVVTEDTFEDPLLAYEETKKALLIISSKLNKSNAYTAEFVKFSQLQENLKKNN